MCSTSELLICWGPRSAGGALSSCRARRHHAGSRAIFHAWHDRADGGRQQSGGGQAAGRHGSVVTRHRRRHATAASNGFFCVPFGGRANERVSDSPPVMWCNPNDERCAHADNAGDSTPAAFLNERTAMVACRRGGGGRRPSATTSLSFGRKVGDGLQLQQCEGERNVQAPRLGLHWHRPSHAAEYGTSSRVGVVPVRADRRTGRYLGPYLALPGGG